MLPDPEDVRGALVACGRGVAVALTLAVVPPLVLDDLDGLAVVLGAVVAEGASVARAEGFAVACAEGLALEAAGSALAFGDSKSSSSSSSLG